MSSRVLEAVRRLSGRQWLLVAAFVLAVCFAGYNLAGVARHVAYLHSQRNEPIAPWMTVSHVAAAYHVPREVLAEAVGVRPNDRRPLRLIAAMRGESFDDVRARLQEAIARAAPPVAPSPPAGPSSPRPPGSSDTIAPR